MKQLLLVFVGGGLGSALRYLISAGIGQRHGTTFPWPTFIVNLGGSFLIGILLAVFIRLPVQADVRLFLATGLLGGFTTFSAFSAEALLLFRQGEYTSAVTYVLASIVGALALAMAGFFIARHMTENKIHI